MFGATSTEGRPARRLSARATLTRARAARRAPPCPPPPSRRAESVRRRRATPRAAARLPLALAVLFAAAVLLVAPPPRARAQEASEADELVVEGNLAGDVFGVGRTVRVRGDVRHGVIAFGGDVIVEGRVGGDAAAVGGSVIQLKGSYIGGDVMVFGGAFRAEEGAGRDPSARTVMFAGYEEELRELARNPASILRPRLTLAYTGQRLLAVLFWFVVSLALTAATPGAVSRAAARLQLTSARVAVIGLLGALLVGPGVILSLRVMPAAVGTLLLVTAILLLVVSYLFGRVVIHAVTGRWLQRVLLPEARRSETVALLLGAAFWAVVLALPFVWPLVVCGLVVVSLGLALTAPYRLGWKRA
jgi:cytoskeletal protein CcmA (bactofilin family)